MLMVNIELQKMLIKLKVFKRAEEKELYLLKQSAA